MTCARAITGLSAAILLLLCASRSQSAEPQQIATFAVDPFAFPGTLAFTADGKNLIGLNNLVAHVWRLADHREVGLKRGLFGGMQLSADGNTLMLLNGNHNSAMNWNLLTGKSADIGQQLGNPSLAYSPDGKWDLAFDSRTSAVRLTRLNQPFEPVRNPQGTPIEGSYQIPCFPSFSRDSKLLAVRDKQGALVVWNLITGKKMARIDGAGRWFDFSPDGRVCAVEIGGTKGPFDTAPRAGTRITLFESSTGKEIALLETEAPSLAGPVQFTADSKRIVGLSGQGIRVWNAANGKRTSDLQVLPPYVTFSRTSLSLSSNGTTVGAWCSDGRTRLWDVASGNIFVALDRCKSPPAFSPDNKLLAASTDTGVRVWTMPATRAAIAESNLSNDSPKPAPAAHKQGDIEFEGSEVYIFNAQGKRIRAPDGDYSFHGVPFKVRGGHKVSFN